MKQSLEIIFNLRSLSQHENKWYHDSWQLVYWKWKWVSEPEMLLVDLICDLKKAEFWS